MCVAAHDTFIYIFYYICSCVMQLYIMIWWWGRGVGLGWLVGGLMVEAVMAGWMPCVMKFKSHGIDHEEWRRNTNIHLYVSRWIDSSPTATAIYLSLGGPVDGRWTTQHAPINMMTKASTSEDRQVVRVEEFRSNSPPGSLADDGPDSY